MTVLSVCTSKNKIEPEGKNILMLASLVYDKHHIFWHTNMSMTQIFD